MSTDDDFQLRGTEEYPGVTYEQERDVIAEGPSRVTRSETTDLNEQRRQEDIKRYEREQERQLRAIALQVAQERHDKQSDIVVVLSEAKAVETYLLEGTLPPTSLVVPGPSAGAQTPSRG